MTSPYARAAWLASCALLVGLAGCVALPATPTPHWRAVGVQQGDTVTIDDGTDNVKIEITSERGIGSAEILAAGPPAKTLIIDMRLKGLEEFRLSWTEAAVSVHVASSDGSVRQEVSLGGAPSTTIDNTSPYWAPVRIVAADPQIPLESGFFAVSAPPAFLSASPERFSLRWIDFYR